MPTPDPSLRLGCHLSSSDGCAAAAREALSIGANTFQTFTRNPRGGAVKPVGEMEFAEYLRIAGASDVRPILFHAPYTLNFAAARPEVLSFARDTLRDDLARLELCPGQLYNFHPGSHVGQGADRGIELIAESIRLCVPPGCATTVLLETMAGKGSEVGRTFEELRAIIDAVGPGLGDRLGVCLDTCHVWDGGYDIVGDLDGVLAEFDRVLGLDRLKAIHLNDSLNPRGSHKDRHAKIGEGHIGLDALVRVLSHPSLRHLPFELETPNDVAGYAREIQLLRRHLPPLPSSP
jgi:deoxyribonuclease-4